MSNNNTNDTDFLKSIDDLLPYHFCIPDYQRGYRWTKEQVNLLLEDLNDFFTNNDNEAYYLLQPVIVKKRNIKDENKNCGKVEVSDESYYEVVDGQQRLTTLYLILKYLGENKFYSIEYATRKKDEKHVGSKE